MFKKITSEIVALVFIFSVTSVDFARAAVMPMQSVNSPNMFNDTAILQNYAKVTSLKNFNSDTVVLNIQDFHMHSGVQQNINSIIKSLSDNCNVQYIYLEGAYDKVNTDWLSNIENKEFKQAIVEKLVKDGKLTGAEIYSVNNNKKDFILPLEDKTIHKENIKRLAKIIEEKPEVLNKLNKREKELAFYQKKYLGSDNIKFSEIVKKYNSGKLDTYDFYKSLFSYIQKYQQASKHRYGNIIDLSIDDYPNMDMYLQVYEIQKKINLKELSEQLKIIIKNLKQELSYSEYSKLLTKTNNFTDKYALISSLDKLPAEYKQKYVTKQMNDFIKSVKLQKNINPVELIEEERALVGQIRTVLSQNKAELEVSFLIDFFKYFKDFMLANISADDHQYFMGQIDKFINLWNKYSFYDKPMLELLERIPFINEYYAVNDYRNEIFMKKINIVNNNASKKELPTNSFSSLINGKKVVVAITGGYHTKGLTELLSKNNVSYAVITPTVLANIDNTYEKYEAAVKEEASIASQTLASAAISLIGLEQSYVIDLLKEIQKDNNFNLDDVVNFIEVLNETKEQKIDYNYDEQNQKLTLSDDNTQIIISNDNVETKILKKQQNTLKSFDTEKILRAINENFNILSTNFGQDIFYPNVFKKLDGFETFLIERNLMPAFSNGFIPEIEKDVDFQNYINENYPGGVLNFVQKSYALQRDYYKKEKNNVTNVKNTEDNVLVNDIYSSIEGKHSSFVSDDLLANAKIGGYAIGAFNMNNLDQLMAIVNAAVKANSPLMIEISEGALGYSADNPKGIENFNYLVEVYKMIAATMPGLEMILHLDHSKLQKVKVLDENGEEKEEYHAVAAEKAIDMGFSSVMLDCSKEPIDTNVKATKWLVGYAHERGARVEAEIGAVDLGDKGYTTPKQAFDFVKDTGVDSLAIAVGTAHGPNKNNPQLQFVRIVEIAYELYKNNINIPLVLHGASAVPRELVERFNAADGDKKEASGVKMEETQATIKWSSLFDAAYNELKGSADYKNKKNTLDKIKNEIENAKFNGKPMMETGVISKVNVATDLLVAGTTNLREQVYTQNLVNTVISGTVITKDMLGGIKHNFEQEETTNLVIGKMEDLGSARKINGKLSKDKTSIPKSKLKPVDELKSKDSVLRYNIGSIEEIQAVVNNIKDNKNIIFTIDENTRQRYDYSYDGKKYNALIFAIETAARYNEDINFAVEIVNTKDIDDALTEILIDILEKGFTHDEKEDKFIIDTSKLEKAELVYLKKAIENKEIVNLQAIADDITQKYLKADPSQHDVRKWGEEYRNKIWVLADALDSGYIFKDIDDDDYENNIIESSNDVNNELNEIIKEDYGDELLDEIRMFDNILEGKIAQGKDESYKPQFAVYAAGGRIGQPNVWTLAERKDVDLSMIIVSTRLDKDEVPYSVYHDPGLKVQGEDETIHGNFNGAEDKDQEKYVRWCEENELTQIEKEKYNKYKEEDLEREKEGKKGVFLGYLRMESNKTGKISHIAVFATREPADINFEGKIVLNTSGHYKTEEETRELFKVGEKNGAKKVLLSAPPEPGKMPVLTNATRQNYEGEDILSGASCTTNDIHIPLLLVGQNYDIGDPYIDDNGEYVYPVEFDGHHARTNSEGNKQYDKERHSSGAGIATSLINHPVFQSLDGKVNGSVIRVGDRYDGSSAILTIRLKEPVKGKNKKERVAEINRILKNASQNEYKGMLGYTEEDYESDNPKNKKVSKDIGIIIDSTDAGMVLGKQTKVSDDGKTIELEIWYDNETGYANQYVNLGIYAGRFEKVKEETISLLEYVGINTNNLRDNDVNFKDIYKVLRFEVMNDENKMKKIKQKADDGNYIAKTIVELTQEKDIKPVETKTKESTIKVEKGVTNNFFKAGIYSIKSLFNKLVGNNANKTVNVDLIYVEDFQGIPQKKFNKNDDKVKLYISPVKNTDINQNDQLVPSGIKGVYLNRYTGVVYVSSKQDIDVVTSNMSVILKNFINVDNSDFNIVVSNEDSVDEDILTIDTNGVIKTALGYADASRNVIKTLKGVMSRNLVVVLEGDNIDDIENQLNVMKEIGNNTITVPAKYFDKIDVDIKERLAELQQNYGISVIIEYDSDIDKKAEVRNAKLGFVGHTVKTQDGFVYRNYSLNETITNYSTLSTSKDIESFEGIKLSSEVVFIRGNALVSYIKENTKLGNKLDAISILTSMITKFVKLINEDMDENLIENFVFELSKDNIPNLSKDKIDELQNVEDLTILRKELNITNVQELILFEGKITRLAKGQNKDTEQLLLVYYKTILKAAYLNNRFYNDNPLGFENRNITKMAERNVVIQMNEIQKEAVENIIKTVENLKDKMNAEQFINSVYELAYGLDSGNIQTAQELLGIEIKDKTVAKAAVFELLMLYGDRKINIEFDKNNDIDDMRNVVNILTAA